MSPKEPEYGIGLLATPRTAPELCESLRVSPQVVHQHPKRLIDRRIVARVRIFGVSAPHVYFRARKFSSTQSVKKWTASSRGGRAYAQRAACQVNGTGA